MDELRGGGAGAAIPARAAVVALLSWGAIGRRRERDRNEGGGGEGEDGHGGDGRRREENSGITGREGKG